MFAYKATVRCNAFRHTVSKVWMSSTADKKAALVERLIDAKAASKLFFDEIASKLGLTNVYVAQLFTNQAHLKPATAAKLKNLVPGISDSDLKAMQKIPTRSFDPNIMQEPLVYRLVEAMQHYGQGIKAIVNEKKGDGIISAIDMYVSCDLIQGKLGEDRFVITLNGKFLSHIEQIAENNTAATGEK